MRKYKERIKGEFSRFLNEEGISEQYDFLLFQSEGGLII